MIRVEQQPEPHDFDRKVRQPGKRFLENQQSVDRIDWSGKEYWHKILRDLHASYHGICAYTCHWIPNDTGSITVEHFLPKSRYPELAYEWHNYRLICGTMNGRKSDATDVLDPFVIENGWFVLIFPSLLVTAAPDLTTDVKNQVMATVNRLKLNDDGSCLKARQDYLNLYCEGHVDYTFLQQHAPFIAMELRRQNLIEDIKQMWRKLPA